MAELRFTNKAVEDLSDIWDYTVRMWSEEQADKYYNQLIEICNQIAAYPRKGSKEYKEILSGLYGRPVGKHIVFYRCEVDDIVEIVRILHVNMDLKNRVKR